ncbi:MAG: UDP-3-O-(3-hydroxymyristoyl)glucosamine N-acyltransferase [Opitutales bacterium]
MAFVFSLDRIRDLLGEGVETEGSYTGEVTGIASLSSALAGDLTFLGNAKYKAEVATSNASVVLLPTDYEGHPKDGQLYMRLQNPSFALALICREIEYSLTPKPPAGVHPSAVIHPDANLSPEASIGPLCVVGEGATVGAAVLSSHVQVGAHAQVGDGSFIFENVVIGPYCEIGTRNRLLPGCVIGSDGYGYVEMEGRHQRVPQIGKVVTADSVDIGANTTVDRARFGTTYIGEGTKIDNQVQIAHNVRIGRHCLIVSQVGISGSTELGDGVVIGGQAGLAGHIKVGDGTRVAGRAGVTKSFSAKCAVGGFPAMDMATYARIKSYQRKLPDLFKRFDQLEKSIEAQTHNEPLHD